MNQSVSLGRDDLVNSDNFKRNRKRQSSLSHLEVNCLTFLRHDRSNPHAKYRVCLPMAYYRVALAWHGMATSIPVNPHGSSLDKTPSISCAQRNTSCALRWGLTQLTASGWWWWLYPLFLFVSCQGRWIDDCTTTVTLSSICYWWKRSSRCFSWATEKRILMHQMFAYLNSVCMYTRAGRVWSFTGRYIGDLKPTRRACGIKVVGHFQNECVVH